MGRMKDASAPAQGRLKIEKMGETLSNLARMKVEAMQNSILRDRDAAAYKQQAASERVKGQRLVQVLFDLKERKRNPPTKVSRMDPLSEYDPDMVKAELAQAKERSRDFESASANFQTAADRHRREVEQLDVRIQALNKANKDREAEEIIPDGDPS